VPTAVTVKITNRLATTARDCGCVVIVGSVDVSVGFWLQVKNIPATATITPRALILLNIGNLPDIV
jgi:hypothetical protein